MSTPPGYPYYPQPGYGTASAQGRAGVIPLRPLSLADIFNGAAVYIRTNPRVVLGLTTVIVVTTQIVTLLVSIGPLASASRMTTTSDLSGSDVGAWLLSAALAGVVGWLAEVLLTGMLTVVAGRAVFGAPISAGETWARIRGRLGALIGLVTLQCLGLALLAGVVGLIVGVIAVSSAAAAVLFGLPLVLLSVATVVYLYTALTFAPVLIVLERLSVTDSITRSITLVQNSFWRVFGIRLLTWVVVGVISGILAAPFAFLGHLTGGMDVVAATAGAIGAVIGRIVTSAFSAGVVVLLYADRRIRSEAFDLVLRSGAAAGPADFLWLTRPG